MVTRLRKRNHRTPQATEKNNKKNTSTVQVKIGKMSWDYWCPTTFFWQILWRHRIDRTSMYFLTKVRAAKMFLNRWCCVSQYHRAKRPKLSASRFISSYSVCSNLRLQVLKITTKIIHHWSSFFQLKSCTSKSCHGGQMSCYGGSLVGMGKMARK